MPASAFFKKTYPQAGTAAPWDTEAEPMTDRSGSVAYLRRMAQRCRRAAAEATGAEARELVELAERCEERLAEREWTNELLAAED